MIALFGFITPVTATIVGVIVLLLFGNRIPSVMRSLGQGVTEFKKGMKEIEDHSEDESGGGAKAAK
jgi:sec-independent protein translocase protein TatA